MSLERTCGVVVDGVRLDQPQCRTVDECVERIVEDSRREAERMKEPPPPDPTEELLRSGLSYKHSALIG